MNQEAPRFMQPDIVLVQNSSEFEFKDEYYLGRTSILHYGLKGIFHILLMREANKIISQSDLDTFIDGFNIRLGVGNGTPFEFDAENFRQQGLLIPEGSDTVVKAFYRDYFNKYPGFPHPQTKEWREEYKVAESLCHRKWEPTDFLDISLIEPAIQFGIGLWTNSVESYEEYDRPRMSNQAVNNFQSLIDYYNTIVTKSK